MTLDDEELSVLSVCVSNRLNALRTSLNMCGADTPEGKVLTTKIEYHEALYYKLLVMERDELNRSTNQG